MAPIKILRIVPSLEMGGVEKTLLSLLPRLDRTKYKVSVCCLYRKDVLAGEMQKMGIPVFCLNMKSKLDFNLQYLIGIAKLISLLKRENIKIVHAHLDKASTPGRIAAILAGVPIIILHKHNLSMGKNNVKTERFLAKFTDRIIAVSQSVRDFYIQKTGISLDKFVVIYNGIDLKRFEKIVDVEKIKQKWGIHPHYKVIGTVSRLKKVKGYMDFLKSAQLIKKEIDNVKFLIVGGGSFLQELKKYCSQLNLEEDVIFTGEQNNVNEFLAVMDVFVLASISEGFGISILEAMAKTKPVVATSVGGIPEIIENGVNGFLIPPHSAKSLAEKLLFLLKNEEIAHKIARGGKNTVKRFTLEEMLNNTESLYDSLIKEKLIR